MIVDKNEKSITLLHNEMRKALKCNDEFYEWLFLKCSSQTSLASLERKSAGIRSMSLNTFKKYCNKYVDGGFEAVDKNRKILKDKNSKNTPRKKKNVREELDRIRDRLEKAERTRAILIKAYGDLNKITLAALANSSQYQYEYDLHKELYASYFRLSLVVDNG